MKTIPYKGDFELITIGMGPGELLLEGIQEAISKHDIKNGVVLSGIGTFKKCRFHYITGTGMLTWQKSRSSNATAMHW
jgi:predicted DNA-binding protein with PD1-like motif